MSNDLISRSALIDELKQSGMIVDNDYGNAMVDYINRQPIAYDVDKVVEHLEENSFIPGLMHGVSEIKVLFKDAAIEIVKAGGNIDNH